MQQFNKAFMKLDATFIRFLLVGVVNTLVGLSVIFISMNVLFLHYWPSTFIGNTIGAVVSYFLNKIFTFKSKASIRKSLWKFCVVILSCYLISYGISLLITSLITGFYGLNSSWLFNLAALVGTGLYTVLNYLGQKYIVFPRGKDGR